MYHYAGNNPVKYIDPDGRFIFTLNKNNQDPLVNTLDKVKNGSIKVSEFSTILGGLSIFPGKFSYFGYFSTAGSYASTIVGSMPQKFIETYYNTEVEALKNYTNGKMFDENCSLELVFATEERYVGKKDDFVTVWDYILTNPKICSVDDLPDKYETEYYVTLRWKDENGKTLGGKVIQLDNKIEYEVLYKLVINMGLKDEE